MCISISSYIKNITDYRRLPQSIFSGNQKTIKITLLAFFLMYAAKWQVSYSQAGPAIAANGQIKALSIGDQVPEIFFEQVINHSKTNFKLSDFKGKLVILDFFGTWCGACMPYIPKLNNLQRELKEKIQIIVISEDPSNKVVQEFINKKWNNKKRVINLPFVLYDSVTSTLFPHRMIPHEVWISPEGTLLATTSAKEVTAENVIKAYKHEDLQLKPKIDQMNFNRNLPLFINGNGGPTEPIISRSLFSREIDGVASGSGYTIDSANRTKRIYFINLPPFMLAQNALGISKNRIMVENNGSLKWIDKVSDTWLKDSLFCYELTIPDPVSQTTIRRFMLHDLQQNLGICIEQGTKRLSGYVLKSMKRKRPEASHASSLKSVSYNNLIHQIEAQGLRPVFRNSEQTGQQFRVPKSGIKTNEDLKEVLKANCLELKHGQKKVDILIIHDNSTN